MIRDRDYILDNNGNYLKVVGDYHPQNDIISYVKYFPDKLGKRMIKGKRYGYNSFVSKSFAILSNQNERFVFSKYHGGILTCTKKKDISKHFSCSEKIKWIYQNKEYYQNSDVGVEMIAFLSAVENEIPVGGLGVTGSFLIDCFNETSDIDLVCYGSDAYKKVTELFQNKSIVLPYENEFAVNLYNRRMMHLASADFEKIIKQERRKIQGLTVNKNIHINCQPLRDKSDRFFENITMVEVGEISCIAEITGDEQGMYSPAYFSIKVIDIIDSLFSGALEMKTKITCFISFIGVYAGCFRQGDRVYLEGKLVQLMNGSVMSYGIELSPWNTSRYFKALLLN